MNFHTILEDCKKDYIPFDKDVSRKRRPSSFKDAIEGFQTRGMNPVIAELKPASPKGKIRDVHDPGAIALEMVTGGACGISVLTEERYFKGSLDNCAPLIRTSSHNKIAFLSLIGSIIDSPDTEIL